MRFGMPVLVEFDTPEQNVALCRELGLDFLELNMNFPEYSLTALENEPERFINAASDAGIFYTIHLDENLNIADFNPIVRMAYLETVRRTIEAAKRLVPLKDAVEPKGLPMMLNMHMNRGIHMTLPDRVVQMFERNSEEYMLHMKEFRDSCEAWIGDSDITITIENTDAYMDFEKQAIMCLLESPVFRLTWDIGHSHTHKEADESFLRANSKSLKHFHIHDAVEAKKKDHMTLGTGSIDIKERLRFAESIGARCVIEVKTAEALQDSVRWLGKDRGR